MNARTALRLGAQAGPPPSEQTLAWRFPRNTRVMVHAASQPLPLLLSRMRRAGAATALCLAVGRGGAAYRSSQLPWVSGQEAFRAPFLTSTQPWRGVLCPGVPSLHRVPWRAKESHHTPKTLCRLEPAPALPATTSSGGFYLVLSG